MAGPPRVDGIDGLFLRYQTVLLLADLVLAIACGVFSVLLISSGEAFGWLFVVLAVTALGGMFITRGLARRARRAGATRP